MREANDGKMDKSEKASQSQQCIDRSRGVALITISHQQHSAYLLIHVHRKVCSSKPACCHQPWLGFGLRCLPLKRDACVCYSLVQRWILLVQASKERIALPVSSLCACVGRLAEDSRRKSLELELEGSSQLHHRHNRATYIPLCCSDQRESKAQLPSLATREDPEPQQATGQQAAAACLQ